MTDEAPRRPSSPKEKLLGAAVLIAIILGGLAISFGPEIRRQQQRKALIAEGADATATILGLSETGRYINENPEVAIRLRVQPLEGAAFETEAREIMSQTRMVEYRAGRTVKVKYDPSDVGKIAIIELIPEQGGATR